MDALNSAVCMGGYSCLLCSFNTGSILFDVL